MRILTFILITFLFSCKASKNEKLVGTQEKGKETVAKTVEIAFKEIKSGENSDFKTAENIVISTQKDMDLTWMKMFGKYPRKPPIPNVDFETKQLVLVAMGEKPNGGYSIKVSSIINTTEGMAVNIVNTKPGAACNNTSALIYPFQLIEMPKTDKRLSFIQVTKINECKE